jgi:hypothetical protein
LTRGFIGTANELINRFRELESLDLLSIREKQREVDAATRELADLQKRVSEAQLKYDRAKRLDDVRHATTLKIAATLAQFAEPEFADKLGNSGQPLDLITARSR